MITKISQSKTLMKPILCNCRLNLMVENVIRIKSGITIIVDLRVKIQ